MLENVYIQSVFVALLFVLFLFIFCEAFSRLAKKVKRTWFSPQANRVPVLFVGIMLDRSCCLLLGFCFGCRRDGRVSWSVPIYLYLLYYMPMLCGMRGYLSFASSFSVFPIDKPLKTRIHVYYYKKISHWCHCL